MEPQGEDQLSQHGPNEENFHLYRSMRDHMHPPRMSAPSCIVPPSEQMIIRPYLVPLLPQFHGMENENPYTHIKDFEETRSIRSWPELQAEFLKKFFPAHRTSGLKRQISNFVAMENEKFYACWERYMEAVNACPHHGFDTWMLVSYFYEGMSPAMKQLLETMCGGDFMSKSPDEALDFLNYVAEISRSWDEPHGKDSSKVKPQNNSKGGMYTLNEDVDVQVKMATLSRRLEELEARGANEIKVVNDVPMQIAQCSYVNPVNIYSPFSNTLIRGGGIIQIYLGRVDKDNFLLTCKLLNLKLHRLLFQTHKYAYGARKRKIPFTTPTKSKGVHEIGEKNENSAKVDEVKAIITLRGGKQVDQPMPKPKENKGGEQEENVKEQEKGKSDEDDRPKQDEIVNEEVKKKISLISTFSKSSSIKEGEKALLDLGASVNLLPYSVYKQLGLGELKPTSITLCLDIEPIAKNQSCSNHSRKTFLSHSKCFNKLSEWGMQLTFGNMTLELNIFHLCKRHPNQDEDEQEEACLIDTLIENMWKE
ncbi:hypothetical protein CK203_063923 [Vitis vinifera]|uniref:Retrotransposon gag domain-containing protein n=1 Tax=Vitis vinifera TaxID=29760 RepID=A0A438FPU3_VITVI|nr:hypothetical protein CK203_063923 [Vitis vinifera]